MSTFKGVLDEDDLKFLSIDNFENRHQQKFLLSHFHSDHFRGLFTPDFIEHLNRSSHGVIYCSSLTKALIMERKPIPEEKIVALSVHSNYILKDKADDSVGVLLKALPAGHCPGSLMFFLQWKQKSVLYTGDFRIKTEDLKKFVALHDSSGCIRSIDSLYIDTTFCSPEYYSFPTRQQSEEDVIMLIKEWFDKGPNHHIGLLYNSRHGIEWLLIAIAKAYTGHQIRVMDKKAYKCYRRIPELEDVITFTTESKIHVCPIDSACPLCCSRPVPGLPKYRVIKPCAMSFHTKQLEESQIKPSADGKVVRVAYSTHCSYKELVDVVKYLNPKTIVPCVVPKDMSPEEVVSLLKGEKEQSKKDDVSCNTFLSFEAILPNNKSNDEPELYECNSDEFQDLDSPPM